jgi:hypothetical protein
VSQVGAALGNVQRWVAAWAIGMAWWQWLLLGLSAGLIVGGTLALVRSRNAGLIAKVGTSVQTVLVVGLAQLVLGVQALAWALPASVKHPFAPLSMWWVVVGGCIVAVALSLWLDRAIEQPPAEK